MEKYVIYPHFDGFRGTTPENYSARIQDAHKIAEFNRSAGFCSIEDVLEYVEKYFGLRRDEIKVVS